MRRRKRIRMLLERPRMVSRIPGRLISWDDFKKKLHKDDLERWAEDEKIPPHPREGH